MEDYEFIQQVNLIAINNDCRATMIDIENRVINIEGPKDKQLECAIALDNQLGGYAV